MDTRVLSACLLDSALRDDQLLAGWERVRDNAGGPGVDKVTIGTFGREILVRLPELRRRVVDGRYEATPLRRVELARPGKSARILAIPSVCDRVLQSAVAQVLSPLLDPDFEDFSFGYRPGRSVPRAVERLCAARDAGLCWIAEADIQSCFDRIAWQPLLERLEQSLPDASLLPLIRHWLERPIQWPDARLQPRSMGVPQGSPLSPLLSNVFLDGLDKALAAASWRAVRYADDFIVAAASRAEARDALQCAIAWLKSVGLQINPAKTRVVHFDQGFTFLGVRFRGKLLTAERPGSEPWVLPRPKPVKPKADPAPATGSRDTTAADGTGDAAQQSAVVQPPAEALPPRLRTLYLTEPGAYLHIDGERLLVGKGHDELASIPAAKVDQVIADTEGAVSFGALRLLLRHDATLLLTPAEAGEPAGLLVPMNGRQVQLRAAQFARLTDGPFRIAAARIIVRSKIANSRVLLRRYRRFRPDEDLGDDAALARLQASCAQAKGLDALRGYEGNAARVYFDAFASLLGPAWSFDTRNRQPPKDPVNALLSYGYAVLFQTVHNFILRRGLDPFVGAMHSPRDGHAALASDLMEPYRSAVVDAVVLRMLTQGGVTPGDFDGDRPGRIPLDLKRTFIRALESKLGSPVGRDGAEMSDWRRIIERDVDRWAAAVSGGPEAYQPWLIR